MIDKNKGVSGIDILTLAAAGDIADATADNN
jgi:hypothetical protein